MLKVITCLGLFPLRALATAKFNLSFLKFEFGKGEFWALKLKKRFQLKAIRGAFTDLSLSESVQIVKDLQLIFINETKKMLLHPVFRLGLHTLLDEQRKLRGSVNLCFHNPRDILDSKMANTILSQCQTVLLFQDSSATWDDYSMFNLFSSKFEFVKGEPQAAKTVKIGLKKCLK